MRIIASDLRHSDRIKGVGLIVETVTIAPGNDMALISGKTTTRPTETDPDGTAFAAALTIAKDHPLDVFRPFQPGDRVTFITEEWETVLDSDGAEADDMVRKVVTVEATIWHVNDDNTFDLSLDGLEAWTNPATGERVSMPGRKLRHFRPETSKLRHFRAETTDGA